MGIELAGFLLHILEYMGNICSSTWGAAGFSYYWSVCVRIQTLLKTAIFCYSTPISYIFLFYSGI